MKILVLLLMALAARSAFAQEAADGPPMPAQYQLRSSAGFPMGVGASASIRPLGFISFEAGLGILPIALSGTAGINLHLSSSELDPAISFLGTYMIRKGTNAYVGTLAYSLLSSRVTSLHSYGRVGITAIYIDKKIYPGPAIEFGLAYGIR